MRACWVFTMLLSCRISHATKSQDVCKDHIKIVCVPAGDVSVPCPKLTGRDVTFDLYKDNKMIYNHTRNPEKQPPNSTPRHSRADVELRENTDNKSFSFTLTGVNASSYGIYGCEGTAKYPPPFIRSTLWTLVLVEGHQCKNDYRTPEKSGEKKDGFLWIWIVGLVLLCIYSLIITIIACIIWVKWRSSDSQSDYMNTKPKAHKDRKKNRGVQIPIPRHF
ncbi:T-cell-specific surface glycoprotein CD28 [Cebidichthys violaceus]|uniref:T-cell-specific surface glycoprotein CD28 n=1 Tax=Cebidichthys violaceus TaxID=271503 RepID=UPI0035CB1895